MVRIRLFQKLLSIILAVLMTVALIPGTADLVGAALIAPAALPGRLVPKFVEPLPYFAGVRVQGDTDITVRMEEFQQKILPASIYAALPVPAGSGPDFRNGTYVWGYNVNGRGANYPGVTVEAVRGTPTTMRYVNSLPGAAEGSQVQPRLPVDQTLHWANPLNLDMMDMANPALYEPYSGSPPAVVHLHGGEVPSEFDGGPEQWFTASGLKGPAYRTSSQHEAAANEAVYIYPNEQEPATLWFHDHTLGATRTSVYAGLAAFYLLRAPNEAALNLPASAYEVELAIQDRMFDANGQLLFPAAPVLNPEHPYWQPEFFGDVMVVNGKSWPYMNVEPRRYRFRMLDGSNARFLNLWLETVANVPRPGPVIWQIGSDGGFLNQPVPVSRLLLGPGERADVIIDFSAFAGQTLLMRNNAKKPYPNGAGVDNRTDGQVMQFRVGTTVTGGTDASYNPATLAPLRPLAGLPAIAPAMPAGTAPTVIRQLTLNENMGMPQTVNGIAYPGGPLEMFVNNTKWNGKRLEVMPGSTMPMPHPISGFLDDGVGNHVSETPTVGSTEIWEIANLTADAHPIHLHLVQFRLLSRQRFDVAKYTAAYGAAFPGGGFDHMTGSPYPPGVYIPGYGPPGNYAAPNTDGAVGGNPAFNPYLISRPTKPMANETGWKDTILMYPGEVTRIAVTWSAQDGNGFGFDATGRSAVLAFDRLGLSAGGPGYVWHCHIVDHEDNEMMRPLKLR